MSKVKKPLNNAAKPVSLLHWQAECPADWASDPRALTVLRTKGIPATKKYEYKDGKYAKVPIGKSHAKNYNVRVALPNDIRELDRVLAEAARDECNLVIRGYVAKHPKDRKQTTTRDQQTICDARRHWFLNDLDGFPLPADFDWRADLSRTARWAVETYLPAEFRNVAFVYQFSASAGIKPGLRLHVWWWLEAPADSATLKSHFAPIADTLRRYANTDAGLEASLDTAVMDSIQEHFVANPIISGPDPLNGQPRQALVEAACMTLVLGETSAAPKTTDNPAIADVRLTDETLGWQPTLDDVAQMVPFVVKTYPTLIDQHQRDGGEWWNHPWRRCVMALKYHLVRVLGMSDAETYKWVDEHFSKLLPGYDADENQEVWRKISIELPPDRQVKIGTFIRYAQGWKPSKAAKEAQKEAAERQSKAAVGEARKVGWLYCVGSNEFYCETPYQRLSKEQFANKYAYLRSGTNKNFADQCLKDEDFTRVDAYTFDPRTSERFIKEDGLQKLNLYRPNIILAQPGDVQRFLDHAAYILPDEKQRHILFQTMAFRVRRPGEKIKWALILYGRVQRTGKSYFGYVERKLHGQHNVRTVSNERLHEPWTDWQEGTMLVIVEELKGSGSRYEVLNKLKPMIVEPITSVRYPGGRAGYDMPNRYNFLMFTNHQDALPLEESDERYCVLSSPAERKPSSYYAGERGTDGSWIDGLWDWTDKNLPAIKDYLANYSLEGFDHNGTAPRTQAFLDMVQRNESDLGEWLREQIENSVGLFASDIVVARHVLLVLPPSLRNGVGRNKIAAALEKCKAVECTYRAQLGKLGYSRVYAIRNHANWRNQGEGTLGKYYLGQIEHAVGDVGLMKNAEDMDSKIVQKFEADGRVFESAIKKTGEEAM